MKKNLGPGLVLALWLWPLAAAGQDRAETSLRWRPLLAGEEEALAAGKPVLYFFTADWCPPCDVLKRTVFENEDVVDLVERQFVPVEVVDREQEDGVNLPEVEAVGFRFLVTGLPTLVVARARGGPAKRAHPERSARSRSSAAHPAVSAISRRQRSAGDGSGG